MDDHTAAAPAATAETAPQPALGEAGFTPHPHAEDEELAQLEAKLEVEAASASPKASETAAASPDTATPETSQGSPPSPPASEGASEGAEPMIPKSRFDERWLQERERGIAAAAYWKGRAEAAEAAKAGGTAAPPELTPHQEAQHIEAAIEQKAQDFDEGRIGLAEFKRFERQASQRIAVLQQPTAPPDVHQDMTLEERTEELATRFPVLAQLDGRRFLALQPIAEAELEAEGVRAGGGPLATFKLRERMSQIAQERYGPPSRGLSSAGASEGPARQQADPTKAARDKLALAGRMPPNLSKSGTAQVPQDRYSLESVAGMDLDDMATAVPETVLRKLSGQ